MAEIKDPAVLKTLTAGEITDPAVLRTLNKDNPFMQAVEQVGRNAMEVLPSIGTGVLKGVAGLIGLPGDISNLGQDLFKKYVGREPEDATGQPITKRLPGAADIRPYLGLGGKSEFGAAAGQEQPRELYQPKTNTGQFTEAASEGGVSMLSGNPWLVALGGTSGIGGELAHRLMPDEPAARVGGSLLPLIAAAPLAFKTPQIVKSLSEALLEARPHMGAAGAAKAQADASLGMNTLFSHGLPTNSGMSGVVREIAASPQGSAVRDKLTEESRRMLGASEAFARSPTELPIDIAAQNQVSKAGDAILENARAARARASNPLYAKSDDNILVSELAQRLLGETRAKPWAGGPRAVPLDRAAQDLLSMAEAQGGGAMTIPGRPAGRLVDESGKPLVPATPDVVIPPTISAQAAGDLANVNAVTGRGPTTADQLPFDRTAKILTEGAQAASPAQAAADMVYKTGSDWIVNPLKEGPVGQSFPKQAENSFGPRPWRTMNKVLDNPQVSADDIRMLAGHVIEQDAEAFPLMVKESWARTGSDKGPGAFFDSIAGNADSVTGQATRAAFREKVYQVHIANGATEREAMAAAQGADNLATAVQTISKSHGTMPPGPHMGTAETAGGNPVSTGAKLLSPQGFLRFFTAAHSLEQSLSRKVMQDISEALVSPEALPRLMEIARYSPTENAMEVITRGLTSLGIQAGD